MARANIAKAGFSQSWAVRLGPAAQTLAALAAAGTEPFDFVFIDANKDGYP